jgi:hypothetical protein
MKKNRLPPLLNPSREEVLGREPLLKFSFYLSDKNNLLLSVADEIVENLDKGFALENKICGDFVAEASCMMWFWTLGAYEVIRTIDQSKECFSNEFILEIKELKKVLAKVRMPSAKMEKQGKKIPVNSNRSPDGWDNIKKDLLIGDPDEPCYARNILKKYEEVMCSITCEDILKRHEEVY